MGIKIALLVQKLWQFCWMVGFCLLVNLHWEGSAPAAYAQGLFLWFLETATAFDQREKQFDNILLCMLYTGEEEEEKDKLYF